MLHYLLLRIFLLILFRIHYHYKAIFFSNIKKWYPDSYKNDEIQDMSMEFLGRMAFKLHLYNPASTTYVKNFWATFNSLNAAPESRNTFAAGYFNITAAIDDVQFKMSSGNFDGTIKMYGIR